MKKIIFGVLILFIALPSLADILLPPEEEARAKRQYEQGLAGCPKDTPLYDGEKCYSCNELNTLVGRNVAENCEKICPNRRGTYECGPSCILKKAPSNDYTYVRCNGWIQKCSKGFFQDKMDGKCYSCKDIKFGERPLEITEEECLSCSNTQFVDGLCYPKCPKNKPLLVDGRCEPCTFTERSDYVLSGCEQCPNRFTLQYRGSVGCYQKCPSSTPLLGLDSGMCFTCNDEQFNEKSIWQPRDRTVLGCSKCPNKIGKVRCIGIKAAK